MDVAKMTKSKAMALFDLYTVWQTTLPQGSAISCIALCGG
ncbi:hypothetical protein C7434_4299 [Pantoea sp. PNA 14-12]|nr:hypothetical protein C7434_4299 [Pantoea sp. PNA 14-12]